MKKLMFRQTLELLKNALSSSNVHGFVLGENLGHPNQLPTEKDFIIKSLIPI